MEKTLCRKTNSRLWGERYGIVTEDHYDLFFLSTTTSILLQLLYLVSAKQFIVYKVLYVSLHLMLIIAQ